MGRGQPLPIYALKVSFMTIVVYEDGVLYTDSKKVDNLQSPSLPFGYIGNKIKVIADNTIAYTWCGLEPELNYVPLLEQAIKAELYDIWGTRQMLLGTPLKPKIVDTSKVWDGLKKTIPMALLRLDVVVMTFDMAISIQFNNSERQTSLNITDQWWCEAVSPLAYNVYRSNGLTPLEAVNKIVADSTLCLPPINTISMGDLSPHNFEGFLDALSDKEVVDVILRSL